MFNIVIEWLTNNWCTLHEYFVITMELLNCHIDRTIHKVCITLSNIWQSFSRPFCLTLQAGLLERFGENFRGGPSNELRESDEPAHDRAIEFWIPHVHWQTQQSNCLKVTGINRQSVIWPNSRVTLRKSLLAASYKYCKKDHIDLINLNDIP